MTTGDFRITTTGYKAFFPAELPFDQNILADQELTLLLSRADQAIGAVNTIADVLPNPELFVATFMQKEALLSSQIEGTQSSLVEVVTADPDHPPTVDVGEVLNYIRAMHHGLHRLQRDHFPMSLRLIREIHAVLMQQVRGGKPALTPGEFRSMQNWIGGSDLRTARFVPPPADAMTAALHNLEAYLHDDGDAPELVRCALIHYQFETIHPFNDGNGRLGRLLITYYLVWRGVLTQPMLYLSAYLKTYQQEYYDRLMQVRQTGKTDAWVRFFLEGLISVSEQVVSTTRRIQTLEREDTERLARAEVGHGGLLLLRHLLSEPAVQVADVQRLLEISYSTANRLVQRFEQLGILKQYSEGKRNRRFLYAAYLSILQEGTELDSAD